MIQQTSADLLTQNDAYITAQSDCEVLIVNGDYVDELLACSQTSTLSFVPLESSGDLYNDEIIDGYFEEEWIQVFSQTPLAAHLSASNLHDLFQAVDDRQVKKGKLIIKESTQGNAFYVIKEGVAKVSSGPAGALKNAVELSCGDYFGDESLVANTPRNANVTMLEEGVLGVLSEQVFEALVKPALLRAKSEAQLLNQQNSKDICWMDVRLPQEFKYSHRQQSVNYTVG
jgi:CRP-like cAMP-binding protein